MDSTEPDGKRYSADALLEGLERIKDEVEEEGKLNKAYIPMLQSMSPGELEHAHNALNFARKTVEDWLVDYKFDNWETRSSTGEPVTEEYKRQRASEIANELSKQSRWKTHGRSLRISHLRSLGLKIRDYSEEPKLHKAIQHYFVLLRITFDRERIIKVFETPNGWVVRRFSVQESSENQQLSKEQLQHAATVLADVTCDNCRQQIKVQIDLKEGQDLKPNAVQYPNSHRLECPNCRQELNLKQLYDQLVKQTGRQPLEPQPKR